MSDRREAIIISTGMDNLPLLSALKENESFTGASLGRVKDLYATFNADKAAMEEEANAESFRRYQSNLDKKSAADTLFFEQQAARYEEQAAIANIAQGSIPANMVKKSEGSLLQGAEFGAGAAAAAAAAKAAARGILAEGGGTQASREVFVLIREFFNHASVSRLLASAMRLLLLLMEIPLGTAAVVLSSVAAIGEFVPRLRGGATISGTWRAYKAKNAALASEKSRNHSVAETLRSHISEAQSAGLLNDQKAAHLHGLLDDPNAANINAVLTATRGMSAKVASTKSAEDSELVRRKALEDNREMLRGQDRLTFDLIQQHELQMKLDALQNGEKERNAVIIDQLNNRKNIEQDMADMAKEKAEEEKRELETQKEKRAEAERMENEMMRQKINQAELGSAYPSLEELAGSRGTEYLNREYGRGGRFDLASGDGPFAGVAYDAELAEKQQMWDRKHGNFKQAELDRQRYNLDISKLPVGALNPQQLLGKIGDNTGQLRELFHKLVLEGAIINTNITGASG